MKASARAFAPADRLVCKRGMLKRWSARTQRILPLLILLPALATLAACHSATTAATPTVTVVVAPANASLNLGMSTQFGAAVSGGTANTVTWTATAGTIQADGTVQPTLSPTGNTITLTNYTAPSTLPTNNQVTITATSVDDTTVTSSVTLTILPNAVVTVTPGTTVGLAAGKTIPFNATVAPAPSADVIWEVNGLPGGFQTVGTISNSGVYTAPPTPPPGANVTITAVSVADTTQSGSATVGLAFGNASLLGPYSFTLTGKNAAGTFVRAGSFVADGQGNVASGLEDVTGSGSAPTTITFVGGYTLGADGRGTLQFNDGLAPAQFRLAMASHTQAQIISYDATGPATGTASGVANLQSTSAFKTTALLGTYLFDFTGLDSTGKAISEVGEFVANGQGGISAGIEDVNDNGVITPQLPFTGTYTVAGNGRGTAQFLTPAAVNFNFYVDTGGEMKFVSKDASPAPAVAGEVTQQSPGATFTLNSLNGNYAFLIAGANTIGKIATVGSFASSGNGLLIGGVLDENNAGTVTSNQAFTGTYTVSASGRGTATLNALNRTYQLVFYLDGLGGAVFQETDSGITSDGLATLQQAAPTASGSYALQLAGMNGVNSGQSSGQFSVNSSGTLTGGTLDSSSYPSVNGGQSPAVTGGALTLASRGALSIATGTGTSDFVIYIAGPSKIFALETDAGVFAEGSVFKQF
jgi:hypothetical protein